MIRVCLTRCQGARPAKVKTFRWAFSQIISQTPFNLYMMITSIQLQQLKLTVECLLGVWISENSVWIVHTCTWTRLLIWCFLWLWHALKGKDWSTACLAAGVYFSKIFQTLHDELMSITKPIPIPLTQLRHHSSVRKVKLKSFSFSASSCPGAVKLWLL